MKRLSRSLILLVFAALAFATLIPLWHDTGWPNNHEGNSFALRTHIYARHFSWLDMAPVWSSADAAGYGSPQPLMYHKLFYMLAGALEIVTGSAKNADVIAIGLLLVAGATGLYLTARAIGVSRLASAVAGCSLITANYTVTNWLVRGALGEFSAAMIAPWVLFFFVRTIQTGRMPIGLGLSLALMWLGHSVLAYFAGLLLAATFLLLAIVRSAPWAALSPRTAWPAVAAFVIPVAPYVLLMSILGRGYDFARILTPPFQPIYQFRGFFWAYVWERYWRFGERFTGLTIELDHAPLAMVVVGLAAIIMRPRAAAGSSRWRAFQPALPFVLVAVLGLLLQVEAFAYFYAWVPGAVYLQFPWRLLALITPALIVVAVSLADALPSLIRRVTFGGALLWMLATCGAFAPESYGRTPVSSNLENVSFSGFREYEPVSAPPIGELNALLSERWKDAGCSYQRLVTNNEEVRSVDFHTSCRQSTVLPLPVYASRLHEVASSQNRPPLACLSVPDLPGVCGVAIPAGEGSVSVSLPTMWSAVRWAWRGVIG